MLRIINALFWLAVWLAIATQYNSFSNPGRLLGQAIIPAVLGLVIDGGMRRHQNKKNSN